MNIKNKTQVIINAVEAIQARTQFEIEQVYMKAYHEGRHDYRNSIKDFLMIKPEALNSLKELSQDPCKDCFNKTPLTPIKIGCLESSHCLLKQNQLLAMDILKYFK